MNKEALKRFQELFQAQKRSLAASATYSYANKEFEISKDETLDEIDLTSYELEQSMRMRLKSREWLYMRKIDEALEKIQAGTFGECEECDGEIEMRRLEARPTASLCVSCKEAEERNESVHVDGHRYKSIGRRLSVVA